MGKKKKEEIEISRNKPEGKLIRKTFWIREKLLIEIMDAMNDGERGEQTRIINKALRQYFRKRKKKLQRKI